MKKRNINLFILGAVILTLALFGCNSGNPADTTAAGALIDGAALYAANCQGCHGSIAASQKRGASVSQIQDAIAMNWHGMGSFASLTVAQIQAIAAALSDPATLTLPPDTTTATTNGTDTSGSSTASLDGAALYTTYCQGCHHQLATSNKMGRTAGQIQSAISSVPNMKSLSNLLPAEIDAIAKALATVQALTPTSTPGAPGAAPNSVDGGALYAQHCEVCHGPLASSTHRGATVQMIQTGISTRPEMQYLSTLSPTEINAIASALALSSTTTPPSGGTSTSGGTTTPDGAALYAQHCQVCHGSLASSNHRGATAQMIQTGISTRPEMQSLSTLTLTEINAIATALGGASGTTTTTPPPLVCGSCHAIPPASGQHSLHVGSQGLSCSTCHGTGYSKTTVNAATHNNGVVNIASGIPPGWNPTTRSCSNSCHGTHSWGGSGSTTPAPTSTPTPGTIDGAALYTQYCSGCHGSGKKGTSVSSIQSAISSVSEMRSLSVLTSAQIQAISTGSTVQVPASGSSGGTSTSGGTTTSTDGAALYAQYCQVCHGPLATSGHRGATVTQIQTGINTISGMMPLSTLTAAQIQAISDALNSTTSTSTTTPPPTTFACGSCHAIPPATGQHSLHVGSQGLSCSTCHGTGYSKTTVNAATHNNGVVNIASGIPPGWNPTTRTCSNSCHGTHSW